MAAPAQVNPTPGAGSPNPPKLKAVHRPVTGAGMDQPIAPNFWTRWPLGARVAATVVGVVALIGTMLALVFGDGARTVRMPVAQLTIAPVEQGIFHDLIPLRAKVVPRDTIYLGLHRLGAHRSRGGDEIVDFSSTPQRRAERGGEGAVTRGTHVEA